MKNIKKKFYNGYSVDEFTAEARATALQDIEHIEMSIESMYEASQPGSITCEIGIPRAMEKVAQLRKFVAACDEYARDRC